MKRFFGNIYTVCVTIFFSYLYWDSGQKDEAVVVFVAGYLSVWVIVTINFIFQIKRRNRGRDFRFLKFFKTPL
jgi:hypothetical protein